MRYEEVLDVVLFDELLDFEQAVVVIGVVAIPSGVSSYDLISCKHGAFTKSNLIIVIINFFLHQEVQVICGVARGLDGQDFDAVLASFVGHMVDDKMVSFFAVKQAVFKTRVVFDTCLFVLISINELVDEWRIIS